MFLRRVTETKWFHDESFFAADKNGSVTFLDVLLQEHKLASFFDELKFVTGCCRYTPTSCW